MYKSAARSSAFGQLPPCMLPVQNRRLYCHQLASLPPSEEVIISLPADYVVPKPDLDAFAWRGIKTESVPAGYSVEQSIVYVLNVLARYGEPQKILHGDTTM